MCDFYKKCGRSIINKTSLNNGARFKTCFFLVFFRKEKIYIRNMVLAELGQKLQEALKKLNKAQVIDETLFEEIMKEICNALAISDVNMKYIMALRKKVSTEAKAYMLELSLEDKNANANLKKFILKLVVDELTVMLGSNNEPYKMVRGKPNVVMFVGL